jgi:hypothetical protein
MREGCSPRVHTTTRYIEQLPHPNYVTPKPADVIGTFGSGTWNRK